MRQRLLITLLLWCIPLGAFAAEVPATLSWDANADHDLEGYNIYRSTISGQYGSPSAQVAGTSHRLSLPQLAVETRYFFVITAVDLAGNESPKSDEVSKLVPALDVIEEVPVATPTLTLTAVSDTSLSVSWEPLPAGTNIDIRIMPAPMTWGSAPSVVCTTSPCIIPSLVPGTTYEALAKAYTGALNVNAKFGLFSTVVSAKTLPKSDLPPEKPKGLIITKATEEQVVITASPDDCRNITTSTTGSTEQMWKRTLNCTQ